MKRTKASMARELIERGDERSFNTLRGLDYDSLVHMLDELAADTVDVGAALPVAKEYVSEAGAEKRPDPTDTAAPTASPKSARTANASEVLPPVAILAPPIVHPVALVVPAAVQRSWLALALSPVMLALRVCGLA